MAINTDISTISQNPALNGPTGSDPVSSGDDAIRYTNSFVAKLRDGVGFTAGAIPATSLAYVPVQQSGGTGQLGNKLYIGWLGTKLGLQVDASNYGDNWPISVSGTAAFATNAGQLGGSGIAEFVRRASTNNLQLGWTGSKLYAVVDGNAFSNVIPADISGNAATATSATSATNAATASNANALGGVSAANFVQRGPGNCVTVEGPRNTGVTGRAIPNTDNRVNYFYITGPDLAVEIDGVPYAIQKSAVSDERLKTNIKATEADSLGDIGRLEFKQFDFTGEAVLFAPGTHRDVGVTAQQAQTVRADWVKEVQGYKHMNEETLLMSALHAIQQLKRRIDALEAK